MNCLITTYLNTKQIKFFYMIRFKHETENDKQEVEDLLDLVFSPSLKNLSSYLLRKKCS